MTSFRYFLFPQDSYTNLTNPSPVTLPRYTPDRPFRASLLIRPSTRLVTPNLLIGLRILTHRTIEIDVCDVRKTLCLPVNIPADFFIEITNLALGRIKLTLTNSPISNNPLAVDLRDPLKPFFLLP